MQPLYHISDFTPWLFKIQDHLANIHAKNVAITHIIETT